jgi:hypothetical protein
LSVLTRMWIPTHVPEFRPAGPHTH